jgi:hypothetical protein
MLLSSRRFIIAGGDLGFRMDSAAKRVNALRKL